MNCESKKNLLKPVELEWSGLKIRLRIENKVFKPKSPHHMRYLRKEYVQTMSTWKLEECWYLTETTPGLKPSTFSILLDT